MAGRERGDNASGQEWKERWVVLQGLNSTDGDVTKGSQKYRSAVGKTGFKEGSLGETASTQGKVQRSKRWMSREVLA